MSIHDQLPAYREAVVSWRRDFHAHPELGFEETRTSGIVAEALRSFGLEVMADFCPAKTAVIGILRTGRPGRTVALRADMDALPMQDEKDVPYRSQNAGVCHACGHDGHTAALLGMARYCAEHREAFCGTLKFVFQPAEEGPAPGGASFIMASGALSDVDAMLGAHQTVYFTPGKIMVKPGVACAGGSAFTVTLRGKGTHAVSPQDGADVIVTASEIIGSWQSLITRRVDAMTPAVISVCSIRAGEAGTKNVLPEQASFAGTVRAFDDALRERVQQAMSERADAIAKLNGCACEVCIEPQFPVLKNDNAVTALLQKTAGRLLGEQNVFVSPQASLGSEDFAWYAQKIPASYFMFGVRNEAKGMVHGAHNPKFDMDEDGLLTAMEVILETARELLAQ